MYFWLPVDHDLTRTILRADMEISFLDLLSSDELTESFSSQSGIDPGLGGNGEFDVFQCHESQGCPYEMDGTFRVDLLTVTNLSQQNGPAAVLEPTTLSLFTAGFLLMMYTNLRARRRQECKEH